MQQIWTNPSLERSFVQTRAIESELLEYLKLTGYTESGNARNVLIFPDMEYNFTFYDATYGSRRTILGLVTGVYADQIRIKYTVSDTTDTIDCSKCCKKNTCSSYKQTATNEQPMPTCGCVLNPPDTSKYDGPRTFYIPIANIVNVTYHTSDNKGSDNKDKSSKGGTQVMLLGISATMVRAIVVRLEFFDDSIDEAIKFVDLKKDGIYDIAYEAEGSIYESRVKVISIEEDPDGCTCCKPGKGIVRENTGSCNSVYTSHCHDKNDYLKEPPVKKVKIIVDSSEDFHGRYEAIMLDAIRNCTAIDVPADDVVIPDTTVDPCDCCEYKTSTCDKSTCSHYIPPKPECCPGDCAEEHTYTYTSGEGNYMMATVRGEDVTLNIKGVKSNITLDTLLKYYLGIE